MPNVARQTDTTSQGNTIIQGSPNVFVNELPIARLGDSVTSLSVKIVAGSPTVFANNLPVARIGDPTAIDNIITGSENVFSN